MATGNVMLSQGQPDVNLKAGLGGDMTSYAWKINGRTFDDTEPLTIRQGQRARLTFTDMTMMWHPMRYTVTPSRSSYGRVSRA
ncbi:multicopper oxidase domain-containing protein [Rhodococcus sp. WAY2]|uniref:multicopper oxidase domain-containing protein n=1 Tax=Rhodococcus sp. WAY2 TaxID=2663121 RepID=UPI00131FCABE|nr:multicopper oxidase domain-containing protein [Rhodococcus sp. WAY2]QHE74306.1 Multicopper oxidase [Rhodococcus sp. WAY2]